MTEKRPPKYFAVLQAARRDFSIERGQPGHYKMLDRDDPSANEFRVQFYNEYGDTDAPLGNDRERAERLVNHLNQAYNFGLFHAARVAQEPRTEPVLVGRMGHPHRNEEAMP